MASDINCARQRQCIALPYIIHSNTQQHTETTKQFLHAGIPVYHIGVSIEYGISILVHVLVTSGTPKYWYTVGLDIPTSWYLVLPPCQVYTGILIPTLAIVLLKAIHARDGLLPASTHAHEKPSSRREGYC